MPAAALVEDYTTLEDGGWRQDLAVLRGQLATQPVFLAEVEKALHDRARPGQGMHLLESARALIAEQQAGMQAEER